MLYGRHADTTALTDDLSHAWEIKGLRHGGSGPRSPRIRDLTADDIKELLGEAISVERQLSYDGERPFSLDAVRAVRMARQSLERLHKLVS